MFTASYSLSCSIVNDVNSRWVNSRHVFFQLNFKCSKHTTRLLCRWTWTTFFVKIIIKAWTRYLGGFGRKTMEWRWFASWSPEYSLYHLRRECKQKANGILNHFGTSCHEILEGFFLNGFLISKGLQKKLSHDLSIPHS